MKRTGALILLLAGCNGRQTPLDPAGDQSLALASLFELMLWICGGAYLFVVLFLAASIYRARSQLSSAPDGASVDSPGLSRGLWLWGGLVSLGLLVLASASFLTDWALSAADRHADLEVRVTGHQWWWRIEYRDEATNSWIETANELHLPAGRTARVTLGSADVIHSFWVPNVAGKMDVIPGRRNVLSLTPRRPGWFRGQCAEFCGTQHALMAFDVKVESPSSFAAWLDGQRSETKGMDPSLARGKQIVTEGACAACHRIRGTAAAGRVGPDLTHLASRRMLAAGTLPMTRGAVQGWILQPRAVKPGTTMPPIPLSPEDADTASRYLVSLR